MENQEPKRCAWVNLQNPRCVSYHDDEWGRPVHDDCVLFEFIVLESAQAGLSWETILNKRDAYRKAFYGFDAARVARMTERDITRMMHNLALVRNERKIRAAVSNARAFLRIQEVWGSFSAYMWSWVGNTPIHNNWPHASAIPTTTPRAIEMSKDLKRRGFTFLGPTIWYAHMQAVGMADDHTADCFCAHRQK